jgi:hypothetical protein
MPRSAPGRDALAVEQDLARGRRVQPGHDAQQRALAAAAGAEDGDEVVLGHVEVGGLQRLGRRGASPAGEGLGDVADHGVHLQLAHGNRCWLPFLEGEVACQADQADHDDAEDDLVGRQQRLAVGDHVADAAGGADQLGHDDVGPGPAEHHAQGLGDLRARTGQQHARTMLAVALQPSV